MPLIESGSACTFAEKRDHVRDTCVVVHRQARSRCLPAATHRQLSKPTTSPLVTNGSCSAAPSAQVTGLLDRLCCSVAPAGARVLGRRRRARRNRVRVEDRTAFLVAALDTSRHVALTLAAVAGLVFRGGRPGYPGRAHNATPGGLLVVALARQRPGASDGTRRSKRRARLQEDMSPWVYRASTSPSHRPNGAVVATRLGNALRAAESLPGDESALRGTRSRLLVAGLYLIGLPDSAGTRSTDPGVDRPGWWCCPCCRARSPRQRSAFRHRQARPARVVLRAVSGADPWPGFELPGGVASAAVSATWSAPASTCSAVTCSLTSAADADRLPDDARWLSVALGQQLYRRSASSAGQNLVNLPPVAPRPAPSSRSGAAAGHPAPP